MKGNLFIGFVAFLFAAGTIFCYWDSAKISFDCSPQYCKYIASDIFDNNKRIKEFALDEVISCDSQTYKRRGRKGKTYISKTYYIQTTTQKIPIRQDFQEAFIDYSKNPVGEIHLLEYATFEFIFSLVCLIIGLFNFITFFKPININFEESDIARRIEEDGLIGLFNKKN